MSTAICAFLANAVYMRVGSSFQYEKHHSRFPCKRLSENWSVPLMIRVEGLFRAAKEQTAVSPFESRRDFERLRDVGYGRGGKGNAMI